MEQSEPMNQSEHMNQSEPMNQSEHMNQSEPMNQSEHMNQSENKKDKMSSFNHDMVYASHLYLHPKSENCVFNQYGQCIKGFRYFCAYCNFGLGGMYSSCHNSNCHIPKYDNSFDINDYPFLDKFDSIGLKNK